MAEWRLPGLIDPHVHLREPGATHKEDFDSGTAAALAGGFTQVLAMPNTDPPLTDQAALEQAKRLARRKARCDFALFLGASEANAEGAAELAIQVCGLKMYLDQTYGPLRLTNMQRVAEHLRAWPRGRPLAVHAEGPSLAMVLLLASWYDRRVHICHVSRRDEILLIRSAKERGVPVTCEVTPHHLFLDQSHIAEMGLGKAEVRPRLATAQDREALWENLEVIDCFASDHAPHRLEEKVGEDPPPGFPGLETALGLMLTSVHQGRLSLDEVMSRMHTNPRRIFRLPSQVDTFLQVDPDRTWVVRGQDFWSKSGWSPFEGYQLRGRVERVVLRGEPVFQEGEVLAQPGTGRERLTPVQDPI